MNLKTNYTMKKIIFIFVVAATVFTACVNTPKGYTVQGTVADVPEGSAVLTGNLDGEKIADTVQIKDGKFTFLGSVTTPQLISLTIVDNPGAARFYLDNSVITVDIANVAEISKATAVGSKDGETYAQLTSSIKSLETSIKAELEPFETQLQDKSLSAAKQKELNAIMETKYEEYEAKVAQLQKEFIAANPSAPATLILHAQKLAYYSDDEIKTVVENINARPEFKNNGYLKLINAFWDNARNLQIGAIVDFTQNDPNGNPVTFSDVYKKHTLTMIDFWASWCGPCRRFNPTLLKIYEKYHKQGFEIVGVSLDRDQEAWLKGVATDKLPWIQVSDLKYWKNEVSTKFNIRYIPNNYFVNAEGAIVGKQIGEAELDAFIAEHLK
ncbi:thiol:disulfide interchange protein [Bacteroidia bacterium]|nr:thiol:disulfide interchange protein [Bacteroidia bacterium]